MKGASLSSAALAIAAAASPVLAQEMAQGPQGAVEGRTEWQGINDIVVTARKQRERDIDVPVAMATLQGADLQKFNQTALSDIARLVPQLVIGSVATAQSGATINLRGIGGDPTSGSVAQPVTINIDGIQISHGSGALLGVHDIARVEVLKGPQTLFYGKNSPGGVISLVSADPTRQFESVAQLGHEFANEKFYGTFTASGPLSDALSGRITVYAADQKGWFKNAARPVPGLVGPRYRRGPGQSELFGRVALQYESPDSALSVKLKLSAFDINRDYGTPPYQSFACPAGQPAWSVGVAGAQTDCKINRFYTNGDIDAGTASTHPLFRGGTPYGRGRQYLASLVTDYNLSDELSLTSTSGYFSSRDVSNGSFGSVEQTIVANATRLKIEQLSEELRLASTFAGPLNFLIGGYYEWSKLQINPPLTLGPVLSPVPTLLNDQAYDQRTRAPSVFGQVTYRALPDLKLQVGGRYSHERKRMTAFDRPAATNGFSGDALIFNPNKLSFSNFSGEATATYEPNRNLNIYATYREGFKSGGFNLTPFAVSGMDLSFDQETVNGAELGLKGYLFDRQVKLQAASYYYKYKGLQLSDFDPVTLVTAIRNAGAAKIYGAEAALSFSPRAIPNLLLNASVGYNHARFTDYVAPCYAGQTIAMGCNMRPGAAGDFSSQDLKGRPLPRAPQWAANLGGTYMFALGGSTKLELGGDAIYSSKYLTDSTLDPRSVQRDFWKINARVALQVDDGAWELALIGKNLTNKLTITSSNGTAFTGSGTGTAGPAIAQDLIGIVSEPRTVAIQLTVRNNIFR
jgi:iron complex outermembrane receptor protein